MAAATGAFWDFSVAVYGRAGVEEACLRLQDRRRADVNLLLYCCWIATAGGGALDAAALARLAARVAEWRETVILPLRRVRRHLKVTGEAEALWRQVKAAELAAERIEQTMLQTEAPAFGSDPDPAAAMQHARASLEAYLALASGAPDAQDRRDLDRLVAGCFPEG